MSWRLLPGPPTSTVYFPPSKYLIKIGRLFHQEESSNHNHLKSYNLDGKGRLCKTYLTGGHAPLLSVRPDSDPLKNYPPSQSPSGILFEQSGSTIGCSYFQFNHLTTQKVIRRQSKSPSLCERNFNAAGSTKVNGTEKAQHFLQGG